MVREQYYHEAKQMKETGKLGENILDVIANFVTEEQQVKNNPEFCDGNFRDRIAAKVHTMLGERSME